MDDRQREHNKRQVLRNRLRQHVRVLQILAALPPPAGLSIVSDLGVELASTRAFAQWAHIDWAAVPVECEATLSFDAGTKDIKRRDAIGSWKGLIPSGLTKKERAEWFARHTRSASKTTCSKLTDELSSDHFPPKLEPQADRDALAALDSASAAAAARVLSERVAQREARAAQRTLRKRLQVESFAVVLHAIIEARDREGQSKALTVVDFGSGSGNMILILATLFPAVSFVAVDMNGESLRLLNQRAAATRLTNVSSVCTLIEDYAGAVDVAFALHACGSATDLALLQAQRARAIFVVSPCCIGKLKYSIANSEALSSSSLNYVAAEVQEQGDTVGGVAQPVHPRSSFMRARMGGSEFSLLVQFADFADGTCRDKGVPAPQNHLQGQADLNAHIDENASSCDLVRTSRLCKVHVEIDRIMAARDVGYWAQMMCLISPLAAAPNKLDLLVGAPAELAVTKHLQQMLSS